MHVLWMIGIVFLAIAVCNMVYVIITYATCTGKTTGTLVATNEQWDYERSIRRKCYSPVYLYEVDGKEYKFSPKKYVKNPQVYEMGSLVTVRYNENNPNVCIINNRDDRIGLIVISIILGLALCFVSKS